MKKIDSLNLIPFIDIMLVLLVIVLTSASFVLQSKIQIDVPRIEQNSQASGVQKESHNITINKSGQLFFDDREISLDALRTHINTLKKDTQIIIRGDKQSGLEIFLDVTTMLRDFGLDDIYVVTEQK